MRVRVRSRVVDHRHRGRSRGRSRRWTAALSWLRRAAACLGIRARATNPHPARHRAATPAAHVLRGVGCDACAAPGLGRPAPVRQCGGDRRRIARERPRRGASHDRGAARSSCRHRPRVAARIPPMCRRDHPLRLRLGATLDNTWLPARVHGSSAAEAVNALGEATQLVRLRLRMRPSACELAVLLTGGLLHGAVPQADAGV